MPVGRRGGILGASCLAGLQLMREMRGKSSIEGVPKGGSIVQVETNKCGKGPHTQALI